MHAVRPLRVPERKEVPGLDQGRDELRVAQRLDAGVPRVHRVLHGPLPVRVLVHDLSANVIDAITRAVDSARRRRGRK